ncbi:MAG: carbohydrate kinase family protein [Deltaproteobacteria bacterium]|nr:carbohydrate kinase family protein [Deltaproteobacteria bacterium]
MSVYISGSLAYDRVMSFPGNFSDYILPDKIHMLNVCFPIGHIEEKRGGTAGNIAYTLALLGEKGLILASAGRDFGSYKDFLIRIGLSLEGIFQTPDEPTAGAYITTDKKSNQITGFHPAAMNIPCGYSFPLLDPDLDLAIIAPSNPADMEAHAVIYRERRVRYIFDPGQQLASMTPEQIRIGLQGALMLVSNDYELELICRLTGLEPADILKLTPTIITTLGEKGSRLTARDGATSLIPPARIKRLGDPTGAGDAYRAGLLKGLLLGLSMEDCALLGSACASFCVEKQGTQEHYFDEASLGQRLQESYGRSLPLRFSPLFTGGSRSIS